MLSYFPYSRYLEETFGERTYKIVVSGAMTCPTRDGTISSGGCAFCDLRGSSSFFGKKGRGDDIRDQIRARLPAVRERFGARKFLAYFQAYTNTYSDLEHLERVYKTALSEPEILGLCIGTRPDCLSDDILDLLESVAREHYLSLELGVQSFENPTLEWLARGHDGLASIRALTRLRQRAPHVHVCAHLIFGSPTDSEGCTSEAAMILNETGIRGVKLHQLMILEGTELARRWRKEPFPTLSIEEYAERVHDFIEHLSPSIYLERLCATATHLEECIAPEWSRQRWTTHNRLRELLASLDCSQGRRLPIPMLFGPAGRTENATELAASRQDIAAP